jgi:signal peptidase I
MPDQPEQSSRRWTIVEARELRADMRHAAASLRKRMTAEQRGRAEAAIAALNAAILSPASQREAAIQGPATELERLDAEFLHAGRKGRFREYFESIGLAVLVALTLRGFVIEAFQIPSASMEPTLLVGDFLFVQKFAYGLRFPFTTDYLTRWRDVSHGDIVVFAFPSDEARTGKLMRDYQAVAEVERTRSGSLPSTIDELQRVSGGLLPAAVDAWGHPMTYELKPAGVRMASLGRDGIAGTDDDVTTDSAATFAGNCIDVGSLTTPKDYIKRVIGLPGDRVSVRDNVIHINGVPLGRERVGARPDQLGSVLWKERVGNGREHLTAVFGSGMHPDFDEIVVRPGYVFAMGDNRDDSSDGRCWGQVPQDNIKGRALFIFFSRGTAGVRWERILDGIE